jgi:hypothetical protein
MNRHLTTFEMAQAVAEKASALTDSAYVLHHLSTCVFCKNRADAMKDPATGLLAHAPTMPDGGAPSIGKIYLPAFRDDVHRMPDAIYPVVVAGEKSFDQTTGLETVEVMNMHDMPGLTAEGDLFTVEQDGDFAGWTVCLWSRREVLVETLARGEFAGELGSGTTSLLRDYLAGDHPSDPEAFCMHPLSGNADAATQLRRRVHLDYATLSGDIFSRRAWALHVLSELVEVLPHANELKATGARSTIVRILGNWARSAALEQVMSPAWEVAIRRAAGKEDARTSAAMLALLESERFVRSGVGQYRTRAQEHLNVFCQPAIVTDMQTVMAAAITFCHDAIEAFVDMVQYAIAGMPALATRGPDEQAVKLQNDRFEVVVKVNRRSKEFANITIEVSDLKDNRAPVLRAMLLRGEKTLCDENPMGAGSTTNQVATLFSSVKNGTYTVQILDADGDKRVDFTITVG